MNDTIYEKKNKIEWCIDIDQQVNDTEEPRQ